LRIAIVTICCDNLAEVIATCESVDRQTSLPDEHWVINGSKGSDIEAWSKRTDQPGYRKFVHEGDRGISDAFNKGIRLVSEGMIQLLNSGDTLFDTRVIERIRDFLELYPEIDWCSGKIQIHDSMGSRELGVPFESQKLYRGMRGVAHPSWFVRKDIYEAVGPYSEEFRIAMDYDMLCRLSGKSYKFYEFNSVNFDGNGISATSFSKGLTECRSIYRLRFGRPWRMRLWQVRVAGIHHLLRTTFGRFLLSFRSGQSKSEVNMGSTA